MMSWDFLAFCDAYCQAWFCAIHPLLSRGQTIRWHIYVLFKNPGGWVGSSLMAVSLSSYQLTIVIVFAWYASNKVNIHK